MINALCKKAYFTLFYIWFTVKCHFIFEHEYHKGQLSYLSQHDYQVWKKSFRKMFRDHYRANYGIKKYILIEQFAKAKIEIIKKTKFRNNNVPAVVLCVRNDRRRIEMLVRHYRSIGVEKFIFLDNGSTDGTLEWMQEQEDIDLFTTKDQYSSFVKEAWINRLVSYYGFDHWYILTDSDELVTYINMEQHSLEDVIRYAVKNKIERIEGLTLDMYSDKGLFEGGIQEADIEKVYCWMDSDSYTTEKRKVCGIDTVAMVGGPRSRSMNVTPSLMKYPLVWFSEGTISADAHFQYPYIKMNSAPCYFGIRHYKFLPEDQKEYLRRAEPGAGFSAGVVKGGYYKKYMEIGMKEDASFMYPNSIQYEDSSSLSKIALIQPIAFD